MKDNLIYGREEHLDPNEFIAVLVDSSLGERRPVHDIKRIRKMLRNANLITGARDGGRSFAVAPAPAE